MALGGETFQGGEEGEEHGEDSKEDDQRKLGEEGLEEGCEGTTGMGRVGEGGRWERVGRVSARRSRR